jgi:hypothetical protein
MFMRFRGGGIGHTSTRAETDVFKTDRDDLDIQSRQDQNDALDMDEEEDLGDEEMNELPFIDIEMIIEGAKANNEAGEEVDQEGELTDSELKDYGYYESESELESDEDSDNEEGEDREAGEEDDTTIDELGVLGYGDY